MITRRHLLSAAGGLVAFSATPVVAAEAEPRIGFMEIKRNGSQPSGKGSADYFTGTVRIDPLFQASEPARGTGASVTFEPGARTAWHTHPLGQTLIVTTGVGRVQRWGGPVEEIRPGDVVLVSARREALARRFTDDGNDPHRHPGASGWQGGRLAGARDRRAIPQGFVE